MPLPSDAHTGAVLHAGRYLHLEPLGPDDGARALANVADGPGDLAAAAAGGARLLRLQLEQPGRALKRLLQRDLCGVLHILPAHRPPPARERLEDPLEGAAAPTATEQVAEVERLGERGAARPAGLLERLRLLPALAVAVVLLPLVRVGEHLVGAVDLLEALLGPGVAGVDVRVVLAGEPAERLPDLLIGGGAGDAQHIVEVARHGNSIVRGEAGHRQWRATAFLIAYLSSRLTDALR